jgi:protease I
MKPKNNQLKNKNVAILATNGFEESELMEPRKVMEENGATTHIVSLHAGTIKSWKNGN